MKTKILRLSSLALVSSLWLCSESSAKTQSSELTADDQGFTELDTRITAEIRKDILAKDGMSTNGKNIKIISQNGNVTLNGEVSEKWERDWIETEAKQVSEVRSLKNNLKVSSNSNNQTKEKDHVR